MDTLDTLFPFIAQLTFWALNIYEWIIIIAILITWISPDQTNPIVVFLNQMTQPLWHALGRRLPNSLRFYAPYASLLLVWFLQVLLPGFIITLGEFSGDSLDSTTMLVRMGGFFLLALLIVTKNVMFFIMFLMLIWFFATLVNPSVDNTLVRTLYVMVDPIITPVQRRLPRSRFDFSPLVVSIALLLLDRLLISQLIGFSASLTRAVQSTGIS